jgi:hypothetical protein
VCSQQTGGKGASQSTPGQPWAGTDSKHPKVCYGYIPSFTQGISSRSCGASHSPACTTATAAATFTCTSALMAEPAPPCGILADPRRESRRAATVPQAPGRMAQSNGLTY